MKLKKKIIGYLGSFATILIGMEMIKTADIGDLIVTINISLFIIVVFTVLILLNRYSKVKCNN